MTNDRLRRLPAPPLLRLYLAPESALPRRIDGAWWPHTSGPTAELTQLLCGLPRGWGRIVRVLVNGTVWPGASGSMLVCDRVVRLRGAATALPDTIVLMAPGHGRRDLLVLPPQATERVAASLLSAAGLTPEPCRSTS